MSNEVYKFHDYKAYLRQRVGDKSARRGLKSALAQAIHCQPTYVSQVLYSRAHFSPEQAIALNEFLGHSKDEGHYFLLLVQKDRAGTAPLKKYYSEHIQELLDRRLSLTRRFGAQNKLTEEHRTTFYSTWHYLAIHIALTVPELQTKNALVEYFRLPMKKVAAVIEFLMEAGLARQEGDRYLCESNLLRIGSDSPHIGKLHSQWRTQALEALDREEIHNLHYTAVVSLSHADIRALKSRMLEDINQYVNVIRQSKEEDVYAVCIDFFSARK